MKIAHIVPYSVVFPLSAPNGRYTWVYQLAKLQAQNGHEVSIYCHPSSVVEDVKIYGIQQSSGDRNSNNLQTFALALQGDHDIYHSHFDSLHYELAAQTIKPIVFTQHWWPSDSVINHTKTNPKNVWAVPPTRYMHRFDVANNISTKGHIYHGIDLRNFSPKYSTKNGRLLFVGRIAPEKNLDIAIAVSQRSGIGLDIIGKVPEKYRSLWDTLSSKIDGDHIRYLGTKTQAEISEYYSSATAVIFPSEVNESFGLVAIEAQASGTPLMMKRGGSRAELIVESKTGFLCDSVDEFVESTGRLHELQRDDCIAFAHNFSIEAMEKEYSDLYESLLS